MFLTLLILATIVFFIANMVFGFTGALIMVRTPAKTPDLIRRLWRWSKWPALVNAISQPIVNCALNGGMTPWEWGAAGTQLVAWWFLRDVDDDDTGKKLKKKLTEKVEQIRGRLAVVPVEA